ncbi:MAG: hypothetical protein ACI3T9_04530 [Romboutsia timonensis]
MVEMVMFGLLAIAMLLVGFGISYAEYKILMKAFNDKDDDINEE